MKKFAILCLIGLSSCESPVCTFRTTEAYKTLSTETMDFVPSEGVVTKTKNDSIIKTILIYPLSCDYREKDTVVIEGEKRVLLENLGK